MGPGRLGYRQENRGQTQETGDGSIHCDLPLVMNGYNSREGHQIRGRLNAGGPPLTIHTHDGNVTLTSL